MKKTILIPLLILFSAVSYAQTAAKKDSVNKPVPVKADTVKVAVADLKELFGFAQNLANHSSDISTKEANGDGTPNSDGGLNGHLNLIYSKYLAPKSPKKK